MTRLRIVPPSAAQLAAAADAPHLVYIAAEHTQRNALAIATSRIGLELSLGEQAFVNGICEMAVFSAAVGVGSGEDAGG